ncbi:MAG TPA: beta-propeller domain-containing protein [Solirubrobacteraceae bacterium]|nr:beta-propeller domain-containing protein [Solirubrobacteraceae bacterium]
MTRRRRLLAPAAAAVTLAALAQAPAAADAAKLVRFDSCTQLTRYAHEQLVRTGGTSGVPYRGDVAVAQPLQPPVFVGGDARTTGPQPPQPALASPVAQEESAAGSAGDTSFSTTNVQEAGVDEADLVKTDGKRLYVVSDAVLRVFDVADPTAPPRQIAKLALPGGGHQLLLRGTKLLVLATGQDGPGLPDPRPSAPASSEIAPAPTQAKVLLTEVDVTDPAKPQVARTMELQGQLAGARLTGAAARIVVASSPQPIYAPSPPVLERKANRTTTRRFLPATTIKSRITKRTFRRSVVPCDNVRRPRAFSGLDLLTVLTVDLEHGLMNVHRDAIMAGAQDVYASPTSLVVASRRFGAPEAGGVTELHRFDATAEPRTTYQGTGTVPGFVLNQFSLSEHEGALRVATTEEAPWSADGQPGQSESGVTVLKPEGTALRQVGRVTGLGKGERIYAVRFLGARGYVVTFRQVDPLYALDLSDPTQPRVTGELKVAGYSAYLHPVSDTLLLGVGQDATEQGSRLGPQVSLFDVANPAEPKLVGRAALGQEGQSAAEQDHHAFLFWAPAQLAVIPVDTYGEKPFSGAIGFKVGGAAGVREAGRITHPVPEAGYGSPPIGRSVVVGDRLLTLSAAGVAAHGVADLAPRAFTPLS